jgi:multidrug resistance efflux pump
MKRINIRNYPFRLRLHLLPILVWLAALACVIGLFTRRSQRFEIVGMARNSVVHVSVNCQARLKTVPVKLFEKVTKGQTVAIADTILDNEQPRLELQTQLDTIVAQIEHLSAQLVPTQETLLADESDRSINRIARMRTFDVDIENARIRILSLRSQIASDQILLEDLAAEVKDTRDLVEQKVIAPYEQEKAQVQYDALAKKIDENKNLLEQAKSDLEQAQQRREEYAKNNPFNPSVDDALEVIRKQIAVQENLMKGVYAQLDALKARESLEVKAPIDGIVIPIQQQTNEAGLLRPGEKIIGRPGEVVTAGEPILSIAEDRPNEIIAYIGERLLGQLQANMPVELIKEREPPQIARSQITQIGPTMELMPERMWLNPNIPQWGRPVLIEIPEGLELIPGETVGIRRL